MDNEYPVPVPPDVSCPPPLPPRRKVSPIPPPLPPRIFPGELGRTDASLNAEEGGLNEKQLRELYDNEEIDRFLALFSDVCNYYAYSQTALICVGSM